MSRKIVLRKEQKEVLKSVEWLLFGKYMCGKTTLLEYIFNKHKKNKVAKNRFEQLGVELIYFSKQK